MKHNLKENCTPCKTALQKQRKDIVLDLSDLIKDKISPEEFFSENYVTSGMSDLFERAFATFSPDHASDSPIVILSQSMGGGKTHNMIALGLLAKHPEFHSKVMAKSYNVGKINVIGFSGRNSSAKYGIWGSLAEQLEKAEVLDHCYSPLKAPSPDDWIELLRGEPLLILLDELPPYFQHALTVARGTGTLADITTTAISNLLIAVMKEELSNVCVVLSDLNASSYSEGSDLIINALEDLKKETERAAIRIEPVRAQGDEFYHILRTRLFESLPNDSVIEEVCKDYAEAVEKAKEAGLTNESGLDAGRKLRESYPFHFSLRDLYARFKENANFQQTRGLIRLMRLVVNNLYSSGKAESLQLIHPYDLDLNDENIFSEVKLINSSLEEAIVHDIAKNGDSIAEAFDQSRGAGEDAQDLLKLLLISSLSSAANPILGLRESEIFAMMARPERNLDGLLDNVFKEIKSKTWYLHLGTEGRYFFKRTQNIKAKLSEWAKDYNIESCHKEIRSLLENLFTPKEKDCYQKLAILKTPDEIEIEQDKTTLIIVEPHHSSNGKGKISQNWEEFYQNQTFQNRVLFLSGSHTTLQNVRDLAAQYRAIKAIIAKDKLDSLSDNDPRKIEAEEDRESIFFKLQNALKETFHLLLYPSKNGLIEAGFSFRFEGNNFDGEAEVVKTLLDRAKFTREIEADSFREKCETRLFQDRPRRNWNEVKKNAAGNTHWPLHHPQALDKLKKTAIAERRWVEEGDYINTTPPQPKASVSVKLREQDPETGEATLRITPEYGDTVYFEEGEGMPNAHSQKVPQHGSYYEFKTKALQVRFLCVDSEGKYESGAPITWQNKINVSHNIKGNQVDLIARPQGSIYYTLDGSDPKTHGNEYTQPFSINEGDKMLAFYACHGNIQSEVVRYDVSSLHKGFKINPQQIYIWESKKFQNQGKHEALQCLQLIKKYEAKVSDLFMELASSDELYAIDFTKNHGAFSSYEEVDKTIKALQNSLEGAELQLQNLGFAGVKIQGVHLQNWFEEKKLDPVQEDIKLCEQN